MRKNNQSSFSVINKLRRDGKSHDEFELMLNNLSLEDVISLKLELASKGIKGGKLYGLPIMHSLHDIVRDAVLRFALSATKTKKDGARFLGINENYFSRLVKMYEIDSYFNETQGD